MVAPMVRAGLSLALILALAAPAAAQVIPDDPPAGDPDAGGEAELDEDPVPVGDDSGTEENPNAPRIGEEAPDVPRPPPPKRTGYPINEILRPLTLPDFTSEISLSANLHPSPVDLELGLRARYGITRQAQIGVRYGIGGLYNDGKKDKVGWNTGKAVAVDFAFLVTDWIAPRIGVPMYVDPFTIGLELGAPVKFRFGDKFAIVGFEDVVAFKLVKRKFLPSLYSERTNEGFADVIETGTLTSDGYIRIDFGAVYQLKPNLAVTGRFGVTLDDFDGDDSPTSLRGQVQFTPKKAIDLIGVMGFDRLDEAGNSFHLTGAIAIRI